MSLSFSEMALEASSDLTVCYDWLAAYDGPSTAFPLIGYFCGTHVEAIYSTGRALTLKFFTDYSVVLGGFRASVLFVDSRERYLFFPSKCPHFLLSLIRTHRNSKSYF